MIRYLLAATALGAVSLLSPRPAHAQSDQQTLVDRSTLALQEMVKDSLTNDPRRVLTKARAVLICPRVFKAGFFFGGEGGSCVLLARAGNGTWSYPAFYGMGSGSFGLQIGIQDAQFVMLIMTERGLNAILNSQFKIGADASLAIATIGAGVQGDTTTALGADIVAFSQTRGLYGGISLQGSVMGQRIGWDRDYYGRDVDARQIVMDMQGSNPGADPLRDVLTRYGMAVTQQAAVPPPPPAYPPTQPNYPPAQAPMATAGQPATPGAVQQQSLPPPR
jgi:SH3 domain-containing YSC84-like protein 1